MNGLIKKVMLASCLSLAFIGTYAYSNESGGDVTIHFINQSDRSFQITYEGEKCPSSNPVTLPAKNPDGSPAEIEVIGCYSDRHHSGTLKMTFTSDNDEKTTTILSMKGAFNYTFGEGGNPDNFEVKTPRVNAVTIPASSTSPAESTNPDQ